jgi:hypothetical protein
LTFGSECAKIAMIGLISESSFFIYSLLSVVRFRDLQSLSYQICYCRFF